LPAGLGEIGTRNNFFANVCGIKLRANALYC